MGIVHYEEKDGSFELQLPAGWWYEPDEEGGLLVAKEDGVGLLHLIPFERGPGEEADPADELYAFLEDQEIELEEDEVEDVELLTGGSLALCEYLAEEGDELVYWMIGVATAPGQLLFASYSCPAEDQDQESESIRDLLAKVKFI